MWETVAQRLFPSRLGTLAGCPARIESASRTDPVHRDGAERADQHKIDFYAREVKEMIILGELHRNRMSCQGHQLERQIPRGEDHSCARDAKRTRGEPSADEPLTLPETPAVPSSSTPPSSTSIPISPWSFFKQWCEAFFL